MFRRRSAVVTFSVLAGLGGLAGCGDKQQAAAPPPSGAALAAAADEVFVSTLPKVTLGVDQLTDMVRKTQPKAAKVGLWSAAQVDDAEKMLAGVVAKTRLDVNHLCAATGNSPVRQEMTGGLVDWMSDPKNRNDNGEHFPQTTWTGALHLGKPGCGGDSLVGPGIVLGEQMWKPHAATRGADLDVDTIIRTTHLLVDGAGHPQPVASEYRGTYELRFLGGRWFVSSWSNDYGWLSGVWDDLSLPSGYLPASPAAVGTDGTAAAAVRDAVAHWSARPGATTTLRVDSTDTIERDGESQSGWSVTETLAPQRGDGRWELKADGSKAVETGITLDHGDTGYTKRSQTVDQRALPFEKVDLKAPWQRAVDNGKSSQVPTMSVSTGAFDWIDQLSGATAVASEDCPATITAAKCYLALVPTTGDPKGAGSTLVAARARGQAMLPLHVGLTDTGELAVMRFDQRTTDLFDDHFVATLSFTTTSDDAPPAVTAPPAGQVADSTKITS